MSQGEGQEIHKEEKSTGSEHGGEAAEEERLPLKVLDAKKKRRKKKRTISSSCFIQLASQIQTTCAGRATSSRDRMTRGAKRYLPSL